MKVLDSVEFRRPVGQWPVGTVGTVVEGVEGDVVLVELVGPDGRSLDTVPVAPAGLRVLDPQSA